MSKLLRRLELRESPRDNSASEVHLHLHHAYLDAERHCHPLTRLTGRHWDLLRLVATGHTAAGLYFYASPPTL
jgi:hypothetical protein